MWDIEQVTDEELDRRRSRYDPLTASIRELIDAALGTDARDDELQLATAEVEAAAARLRAHPRDGAFRALRTDHGRSVTWGNLGDGLRNPLAPPLAVRADGAGRGLVDVELGAPYEGASGLLHGGYAALVIDHLFGYVASRGSVDSVAVTGTITLRYHRPTRLGLLHAEAEIQRTEGRKIFLTGHLGDADGSTVTAEGLFIELRQPGA